MEKKAGVGKVLLIVFGILILLVVSVGIYLYYFHVFVELRVCISEEGVDSLMLCDSSEECVDAFMKISPELAEFEEKLKGAPEFIQMKFDESVSKVVYCDNSCRVRGFRGGSLDEMMNIESCSEGEEEILIEIRGKEAVAAWGFMKRLGNGE